MFDLAGKTAVVTGGSSGIGFATARQLKALGATVVITGRNQEALDKAAAELDVAGIRADQASLDDIDQLVSRVQEGHGAVDVLFLNAGIAGFAPFEAIDEAMFDAMMGINFKGTFFTLQKFLPALSDGASVINLASLNSHTGMANTTVYAASKAAVNALTRTASAELAPRGIRVNSINPGPIQTELFSKLGMPEDDLAAFATTMGQSVPLRRLGLPDDVTSLVAYLASDASSFVTGAEFNVDGGLGVNPVMSE